MSAACARGGELSVELLRLLLDAGADPDMRLSRGMQRGLLTPSLRAGAWDCAELLLSRMKNPLAVDEDGFSPVFAATMGIFRRSPVTAEAILGFAKMCSSLAALGADFNLPEQRGNNSTPLIAAGGTGAAVEILLSHGANPNAANGVGLTPLMGACHEAMVWGDCSAAKALVSAGADIYALDDRGIDAIGYLTSVHASHSPISATDGASLTLCFLKAGWRLGPQSPDLSRLPGFSEGMAQWEKQTLSATSEVCPAKPRSRPLRA